jgi:hypothetical protein
MEQREPNRQLGRMKKLHRHMYACIEGILSFLRLHLKKIVSSIYTVAFCLGKADS